MADFNRGISFSSTETVTPSKLHDLMDLTTISNVGTSDLATGHYMVNIESSRPSDVVTGQVHLSDESELEILHTPVAGTATVNWIGPAGQFQVFNGSGVTIPDLWAVRSTFSNNQMVDVSVTVGPRHVVPMHTTGSLMDVSPYFVGIVQEPIAPQEWGAVVCRGRSLAQVLSDASNTVTWGSFLRRSSTVTGAFELADVDPGKQVLAMLLADISSPGGATTFSAPVIIMR